jgi:DNA-binding transcriptional LysR family regulator
MPQNFSSAIQCAAFETPRPVTATFRIISSTLARWASPRPNEKWSRAIAFCIVSPFLRISSTHFSAPLLRDVTAEVIDLESLIPRLEDMVRGEKFDPARSQEVFRVAMSDHASMIVLPSLLASVRRAATHVKLEVSAAGAETYEDVAAGRINTVLCAEEAPPSLESEMLFTLDFVCLVGAALPVRARRLTLKQYLEFQHVLVELRDGQQALVDRALSQLGAKRHVALTLPFFVPAIFAIPQTDLILTVPRRLAKITAVMAGVRVVEAPREIKSFPYFMAWHPRLTNEPAHKWFREQLRSAVRTV